MTSRASQNKRSALKLAGVFVLMFGFSFAMVPLYDVLCDITGLGGRAGVIQAEDLKLVEDSSRRITVEFMADTNSRLPWHFVSKQASMQVQPGKVYEAIYTAKNTSRADLTGQAVHNVNPPIASKYFSKTECFCFTNQLLAAGEGKDMPVRFIVDPALPRNINTVTLSYTFFKIDGGNG
ncbi:MAG: cytochrome c oxidase assembly protein [Gammaproteobacteria bacterium]|nr:cytochrome c oxidase assembly protein [Gammaproteobacteria bacterium]